MQTTSSSPPTTTTTTRKITAPTRAPPSLPSSAAPDQSDAATANRGPAVLHALRKGEGNTGRRCSARLRDVAVTAASCGIIAFYASWRLGLLGRVATLAGRCRRAVRALPVRLPPLMRSVLGPNKAPACGSAGHSVRMVALPPTFVRAPPSEATATVAAAAGGQATGPSSSTGGAAAGVAGAGPVAGGGAAATAAAAVSDGDIEVHVIDLGRGSEGSSRRLDPEREAIRSLARDLGQEEAVGLDAEWEPELQPGERHRISVIQLSSAGRCWILRPFGGQSQDGAGPSADPSVAPSSLPAEVVRLLTDPRVIKAGVGIQEDVRRLERDFGVQVRGAVDVRLVAQRVAPQALAGGGSLRALSAALLGRALDKSAQRSHWGAGQLHEGQIAYAAHDAWLSRELLCELFRLHQSQREGRGSQPPPGQAAAVPTAPAQSHNEPQLPQQQPHQQAQRRPLPAADGQRCVERGAAGRPPAAGGEESAAGVQTDGTLLGFAAPFLDVFNSLKTKRLEKALGTTSSRTGPVASSTVGAAAAARRKERKLPTRKSVLYENCRLLAPDGAVLCTCGAKKVAWYLQRGLAHVVSENPTTIQLTFEPRGRGHADDMYYLSDKENRCCVCGAGGEYLRHSVVPHCYRQHFPASMKSHLSHDIVLMCPTCHKTSSVLDQRRMETLGGQFRAPLGSATAAKFRHDSSLGVVRSAGRALANPKVVIPPARRRELEAVLQQHFGVEAVDAELIQQAANVDPRSEDENWRSHAEIVVRALGSRENLEGFVRGWRQHFLDTMRPRFMPPHWRVDARVANSSVPEDDAEGAAEDDEEAGEGEESEGWGGQPQQKAEEAEVAVERKA